MIQATLSNYDNRYEAVLAVARKAKQRALLEQMGGGPEDENGIKPILSQLQEELDAFEARDGWGELERRAQEARDDVAQFGANRGDPGSA